MHIYRFLTRAFLSLCVFLMFADASLNAKEFEQAYKLSSGDELKIIVYNEPELSGAYTLSETGAISMPLIGQVSLAGYSMSEAEKIIANAYLDGFLVNPSVTIEVESHGPFYILGEVRRPGSYPYKDNMTVLQAVALAGGFTYRARQTHMVLKGSDGKENKIQPEAKIMPGDVVIINERFF